MLPINKESINTNKSINNQSANNLDVLSHETASSLNESTQNQLNHFNLINKLTTYIEDYKNDFKLNSYSEANKYTIAFFGPSGKGKSSLINILINGKNNYPLATSGATGKGCTQNPLKIFFSKSEKIIIKRISEKESTYNENLERLNDVFEFEPSDENAEKIKNSLHSWNSEKNKSFIEITWPVDDKNQYLENFQFLDLLGHSDNQTDVEERNKYLIDKVDGIDCIFLVTRADRGQCKTDDIQQMRKNHLFKKVSKYSAPKIVVVRFEMGQDTVLEDQTNSIIHSISELFGYKLEEDFYKKSGIIKFSLDNNFSDFAYIHERDSSCRLMIKNCQFLTLFVVSVFNANILMETNQFTDQSKFKIINLIDAIKEFKTRSIQIDQLNQKKIKLNEMVNKFRSMIRKKNIKTGFYHNLERFFTQKTYNNMLGDCKKDIKNIFDQFQEEVNQPDENFKSLIEKWKNIDQKRIEERVKKFVEAFKKNMHQIWTKLTKKRDKSVLLEPTKLDQKKLDSFEYYDLNFLESCFDQIEKKEEFNLEKTRDKVLSILENFSKVIIHGDDKKIEAEDFLEKTNLKVSELESHIKDVDTHLDSLHISHFGEKREFKTSQYGISPKPFYQESKQTLRLPPCKINKSIRIDNIKDFLDNINLSIGHGQRKFLQDVFSKYKSIFNNGLENKLIYKVETQVNSNDYPTNFGHIIEIKFDKEEIILSYDTKLIAKKIETHRKHLMDFENKFHKENQEEKVTFDNKSQIKSAAVSPIFMWYTKLGIKSNQFISDLKKSIQLDKMLIILLFESHDREDFNKFDNIYLKPEIENESYNPIVSVFIQNKNLGVEKIHRIMMMLAEHFNFNQFFSINEDIGNFSEFNGSEHVSEYNTCAKTLTFMSKALNLNIKENEQIATLEEGSFDKIFDIFTFTLSEKFTKTEEKGDFTRLFKLFSTKNYQDQSEEMLFLIEKLQIESKLTDDDDKRRMNEFKDFLTGTHSKTLGMLSLIQKSVSESDDYSQLKYFLRGLTDSTHAVKKLVFTDVVLYNLNAIRNVHPIFHKSLFESNISDDITKFYESRKKFSDLLYHYYISNYVFNATVYYFCYEKYESNDDENEDEEYVVSDTDNEQESPKKKQPQKRKKPEPEYDLFPDALPTTSKNVQPCSNQETTINEPPSKIQKSLTFSE